MPMYIDVDISTTNRVVTDQVSKVLNAVIPPGMCEMVAVSGSVNNTS